MKYLAQYKSKTPRTPNTYTRIIEAASDQEATEKAQKGIRTQYRLIMLKPQED